MAEYEYKDWNTGQTRTAGYANLTWEQEMEAQADEITRQMQKNRTKGTQSPAPSEFDSPWEWSNDPMTPGFQLDSSISPFALANGPPSWTDIRGLSDDDKRNFLQGSSSFEHAFEGVLGSGEGGALTGEDAFDHRFGAGDRLDSFARVGMGGDPDAAAMYYSTSFHEMDGKSISQINSWLADLEWSNPEKLASFQLELQDAGYYQGKEPLVFGRMDPNTQLAIGFLLNDSSRQPGRSIGEILRRYSGFNDAYAAAQGRGRGSGRGSGGVRAPAYQQSSVDNLSLLVDSVSQAVIGRRISDEEKATIVADLQSKELSQQQAAFAAQQSGGTFTMDPVDVMATRQVTDQYADEYGATQYSQQVNVLRSMLGGI